MAPSSEGETQAGGRSFSCLSQQGLVSPLRDEGMAQDGAPPPSSHHKHRLSCTCHKDGPVPQTFQRRGGDWNAPAGRAEMRKRLHHRETSCPTASSTPARPKLPLLATIPAQHAPSHRCAGHHPSGTEQLSTLDPILVLLWTVSTKHTNTWLLFSPATSFLALRLTAWLLKTYAMDAQQVKKRQ